MAAIGGAAAASDAASLLLPWLVREAPPSIDAVDLAAALSAAPADVLRSAALRDALAARGGNAGDSLEARLLRVDEDGVLSSLGGLGVRERLQVLRFFGRTSMFSLGPLSAGGELMPRSRGDQLWRQEELVANCRPSNQRHA